MFLLGGVSGAAAVPTDGKKIGRAPRAARGRQAHWRGLRITRLDMVKNRIEPVQDEVVTYDSMPAERHLLSMLSAKVESLENQMKTKTDTLGDAEEVAKAQTEAHKYFWMMDDASESPSDLHQACAHFVLTPYVPMLYKLKYVSMSVATIVMQALAMFGLLASVESMTEQEINESFQSMMWLDWCMHLMLCVIIGCIVNAELEQSQVCEAQITQAWTSSDPAVAANARRWAPPLVLSQKLRQLLLIPVTVATCPILAMTEGVESLEVALNVLATLFVFDLDDAAFNAVLSRSQRAYLGICALAQHTAHVCTRRALHTSCMCMYTCTAHSACTQRMHTRHALDMHSSLHASWMCPCTRPRAGSVVITLQPHDLSIQAWASIGIGLAVFLSVFFPLLLYHPGMLYASAAPDQKFSPGYVVSAASLAARSHWRQHWRPLRCVT